MIITQVIIVAAVLGLLAYNIVAAVVGGTKWTISYVLYRAGQKYPIIASVAGGLLAHLFWRIAE